MTLTPIPRAEPDGRTVLLVEDDDLVREAMVDELEAAGWRVFAASSCDDALAFVARGVAPTLILLDILMPGMPADRFRRILATDPVLAAVPVIVTTAKPLEPGFTYPWARATLKKPFRASELRGALAEHGLDG